MRILLLIALGAAPLGSSAVEQFADRPVNAELKKALDGKPLNDTPLVYKGSNFGLKSSGQESPLVEGLREKFKRRGDMEGSVRGEPYQPATPVRIPTIEWVPTRSGGGSDSKLAQLDFADCEKLKAQRNDPRGSEPYRTSIGLIYAAQCQWYEECQALKAAASDIRQSEVFRKGREARYQQICVKAAP